MANSAFDELVVGHRNMVLVLGSALLGAVAGAGWGVAAYYLNYASQNANTQVLVPHSLWPDPLGFLAGAALAGGLAFALARLAVGATAVSLSRDLRQRISGAGLDLPQHADESLWKPSTSEDAALEVAEKSAHYILTSRKEMVKYKEALAKYADPTLALKLNVKSDYTKVETRKVNAAILFCDIRGFTQISEALKVEEVVTILNDYFSFGTQAVTSNGGQVNKFIGDAILAIFQDPPEYSSGMQACRNAASAAMALQAAFAYQKQKWRDKISTPFDAHLGVGVHFGEVILGNLGSPERMEYTAIGDTVNFSSRLCSLALASQILLSEKAYGVVSDRYTADESEPLAVKGKSGMHKTYLITGKKPGNF